MATDSNRVILGTWFQPVVAGERDEEGIADVDEEEEAAGEARAVFIAKTQPETTTMSKTDTATEIEMEALDTNDSSDAVHLRKAIRADNCGAGDRSQTQGELSVLTSGTERKRRD
jgi:hypothetical protein